MTTYKIGRDTTRIGTWTVTINGKVYYKMRKAEAIAFAKRMTGEK